MIEKEKRGNKNMDIEDYEKYIDELRLHGTRELAEEIYKLEQQTKEQKETIDKAIEYIEKCLKQTPTENREKADDRLDIEYKYILDILNKEK